MSVNGCAFDGMNELKNETEKYLCRYYNTYEFVASVDYIQRYANIAHLHAAFDLNVSPHH